MWTSLFSLLTCRLQQLYGLYINHGRNIFVIKKPWNVNLVPLPHTSFQNIRPGIIADSLDKSSKCAYHCSSRVWRERPTNHLCAKSRMQKMLSPNYWLRKFKMSSVVHSQKFEKKKSIKAGTWSSYFVSVIIFAKNLLSPFCWKIWGKKTERSPAWWTDV